jgi:hypothetical protein
VGVWSINTISAPLGRGQASPLQLERLGFGQFGISTRVPPHCFRLASLDENATARRSVAHLTLPNAFSARVVGEYADAIFYQESSPIISPSLKEFF